ncbi:6-pyruvoyl tetrahydropterin synthase family protein [Ekhidna sp.]|uniref:6-pyruvoyl trahydropterin synthase family protein n=1 Tax=Ekhidna sp. TaxID=2608089 RepID=UPI00351516DB
MPIILQKHHFNAAHKLFNPNWSDEKNAEVFGPCANVNWHGHNFELIVGVRGDPDPETGYVIDPQQLSSLVQDEIIEKVDHKNLNLDVPFMFGKMASCESLVVEFWKILQPKIQEVNSNAKLHRLRLYETPRNFVDYYGE